jgi:hypothetical protein
MGIPWQASDVLRCKSHATAKSSGLRKDSIVKTTPVAQANALFIAPKQGYEEQLDVFWIHRWGIRWWFEYSELSDGQGLSGLPVLKPH